MEADERFPEKVLSPDGEDPATEVFPPDLEPADGEILPPEAGAE